MLSTTADRLARHDALPITAGMLLISLSYKEGLFLGISDKCTEVIWMIADLFGVTYREATNIFAAEMRNRYEINVH